MIFKRTLKRKIQNSMISTAFISLLIALIIILPLIYIATIPVTTYISSTINNYISQNYSMSFETNLNSQKKMITKSMINSLTVEDIINSYSDDNYSIEEQEEIMEEMIETRGNITLEIDGFDEDSQKIIILSMIKIIKDIKEIVPLDDVILTEFELAGETIFSIPENKTTFYSSDIVHFESMHNKENNMLDKKLLGIYEHSKSTLTILDQESNLLGTITTAVNPYFVFIVMGPIILVFLLASILALLVANLMSRLLSIPILKPIKQLNKQLTIIAGDDLALHKHMTVEVKRPPKEIEQLRDNSNLIMEKMKIYAVNLENYKDELEAQNYELEAQNLELADSKTMIESQQNKLVQSEKMASIGQLSAAIAHEINTPLGAIKSNCQMIEMVLPIIELSTQEQENEKLKKAVKNIKRSNDISLDASKRMGEIIKNLKNFSRLDQSNYQEANINEGIQSVLVLTSNLWKNKITLKEDYGELPLVECYPSMLNQVFMNVIVNAIQASDNISEIEISTYVKSDNIVVKVKDFGTGISPENLSRIFDSGFTTKDKNNGTGLGLSISRDILKKHNGTITVESVTTEGSTFTIEFPISHDHKNC